MIKDFIQPVNFKGLDRKLTERMINNIFDKTVLVENPQIASQIAKEEEMNAVTTDGEVFYAGSYVAKLGYFKFSNSKLTLYNEIK